MHSSLNEIWTLVLAEDSEAWEELVLEYSTLVYSVARRCGLDTVDAEDCSQQTWMALYKSKKEIRDANKVPNWLASTAYRRAMRIHRNKYNHEKALKNITIEESSITPDEHLCLLQRRKLLEDALKKLDVRCRTLLHSLFLSSEDESYERLSKKYNIPLNSIGPTRKRCLDKLKKILKQFDEIWY